jgi:Transcriptional regulators
LAARLGLSRAPVREALRVLEREGLVALTPWRGARLIDPSLREIADLFDLVAAVEGVVVRLAVRHAREADLKRYARLIARLERHATRGDDILELVDLAYAASGALVRACGSGLVASLAPRLARPAYWMHRFLMPAPRGWQKQSLNHHLRLRDAILARDEAAAERCARRLVEHTRRLILTRAEKRTSEHRLSDPEPAPRRGARRGPTGAGRKP